MITQQNPPQLAPELGMYTPVRKTILYYQNAMEMFTTHKFESFYNTAILCLDELTFDVYSVPQVVKLPVRPNKTVALPQGYINYIRMQVQDERGEVVDLVINKGISNLSSTNSGRPTENDYPSDIYGSDFFSTIIGYDYIASDGYPGQYGHGGIFQKYGEFNIDTQANLITLPTNYPYDNIVLYYMSNEANKNADGEYVVHVFAQMSLMRQTDWMIKSFNTKKFGLGEVQLAKQYADEAKGLAISRFSSFTPEEFLKTVQEQIMLAPKG